jgi:hypothetical protein
VGHITLKQAMSITRFLSASTATAVDKELMSTGAFSIDQLVGEITLSKARPNSRWSLLDYL